MVLNEALLLAAWITPQTGRFWLGTFGLAEWR
jgi:hypothetical protein